MVVVNRVFMNERKQYIDMSVRHDVNGVTIHILGDKETKVTLTPKEADALRSLLATQHPTAVKEIKVA